MVHRRLSRTMWSSKLDTECRSWGWQSSSDRCGCHLQWEGMGEVLYPSLQVFFKQKDSISEKLTPNIYQ